MSNNNHIDTIHNDTENYFVEKTDMLKEFINNSLQKDYKVIFNKPYSYRYPQDNIIMKQGMALSNTEKNIIISICITYSYNTWSVTAVGIEGCSFTINTNFSEDQYFAPITQGFASIISDIIQEAEK